MYKSIVIWGNIFLVCEVKENVVCCIFDDWIGVLYFCLSKCEKSIEYFFKYVINFVLLMLRMLDLNI